jgi:D-alanine-D-alanine ligase-like ATP-grasp enzyme
VTTWPEFLRAAALASLYGEDILLERMMPGESCRLLFLDGRLIHAVRRRAMERLAGGVFPVAELRTVYDETVTHLCGEPLVAECARIVAALGSEFAGIDLICNDLGRSLAESGGTFLEINTTPGIHHHYIGSESHSANPVAKQVLAYLLRDPRRDGAHHGNG